LKPIFVLGTGRTGSYYIADMMKCAKNVSSKHEPKPLLRVEGRKLYEFDYCFQSSLDAFYSSRSRMIEATENLGMIYFESNGSLSPFAPYICKMFPDARVIWVVRDGRNCVNSWCRGPVEARYNDEVDNLHFVNVSIIDEYTARNPKVNQWYSGMLRPKCGDKYYDLWNTLKMEEKLCWRWNEINQILKLAHNNIPKNQRYFIRLEDYKSRDTWLTLFNWLGFSVEEVNWRRFFNTEGNRKNMHRAHKSSRVLPKPKDWPPYLKDFFKEVAGELLIELGYEKEGNW
jgi:hypothetical protein